MMREESRKTLVGIDYLQVAVKAQQAGRESIEMDRNPGDGVAPLSWQIKRDSLSLKFNLTKLTPTPQRRKNYFFPRIMFSNNLKNLACSLEGAARGARDLAMLDLISS